MQNSSNASKDGSMINVLQPPFSLHYQKTLASEGVDGRQDGIDVSKHTILERRTRIFKTESFRIPVNALWDTLVIIQMHKFAVVLQKHPKPTMISIHNNN